MKRVVVIVGVGLILIVGGFVALYALAKPAQAPATPPLYVALGDSVAAGVGIGEPADSSACDRSTAAYSYAVARQNNLRQRLLACSGATISNGIIGKQAVNELLVDAQLDQLFRLEKPALVSITIGANDAGWADYIRQCYTGSCGSASDTAAVDAQLETLTRNYRTMLSRIDEHYGMGDPVVVATDYHQVYPPTKPRACGQLIGIGDDELTWLRDQRTKINAVIKASLSDYRFVRFADADFTGHELCSADSWVQGLTDARPYHPTLAGQSAIATRISAAYKEAR